MRMTSANVNKLIKKLQDDKSYLISQEHRNSAYTAAENEDPVVPDYDYDETTRKLAEIDDKIVVLKHKLNVVNSTCTVDVQGTSMTIDEILVRMAQLNSRKSTLGSMRNAQPKSRLRSMYNNSVPEYQYANYDISRVAADYEELDAKITAMQLALDKFNQTFEFDVDIEL